MTSSSLQRPPRVLFVGGPDAATSRLAAGLLRRTAGDRIEVSAAQTRLDRTVDPQADLDLAAAGLDPAAHPASLLSTSALYRADHVVSLSRSLDLARVPGPHYETWDTTELGPLAGDGHRVLAARVQALATDLTVEPSPRPARSRWAWLRTGARR